MEKTLNEVFRNRVKKYGDKLCVEKKLNGKWETATWNEYYDRSRKTGLGLYDLGVRKGEMVAILSQNRLEWIYTDMGTLGFRRQTRLLPLSRCHRASGSSPVSSSYSTLSFQPAVGSFCPAFSATSMPIWVLISAIWNT